MMPEWAAARCQQCDRPIVGRGWRCADCRPPFEAQRASSRQRGYTRRWEQLRRSFLEYHPLCGDRDGAPTGDSYCQRQGLIVAAEHVDHIIPIRQSRAGQYDTNNLQALCASCHSRKTASGR
ncbi:MAG: HNH endonuclease [Mycobacteriaceae bacterium]|nr:HNH endonuclease [Mycobacteriaceae bacterium]